MPKLRWTFLAAIVLGAAAVLVMAAVDHAAVSRRAGAEARADVDARQLAPGVWISGQIGPEQLGTLKSHGFRSVIDLRPDNEAAGQPPASAIGTAAAGQGLAFDYIPVSHGDVPSDAVDALSRRLAQGQEPVLLYCRSGRRAARTWALAEASRPGGLQAASILEAVKGAGQDAADLADQIAARVAARPTTH